MEGLKQGEAKLVVHIHPSKDNGARESILTELNSLLFTYSEIFANLLQSSTAYANSTPSKILPGIHPSFGVRVDARLLLFKPTPETILEGRVVKITPRLICAVVLGFSFVFMSDEDIREDFKHKVIRGEEVYVSRTNSKHTIKVGTFLRFVVKSFDQEALHIAGSMVAKHTGCARWLDRNVDEWSQAHSTKKKRKSGNQNVENQNNESLTTNEKPSSVKSDKQAKKGKKRRTVHI